MGNNYTIVNPAKKEVLDPFDLGEGTKWNSLLRGPFGVTVLKLLLADEYSEMPTVPSDCVWRLEGHWFGDPVTVANENGPKNPRMFRTGTDEYPDRNLHWMAKYEFADITPRCAAMLTERHGFGCDLVNQAKEDNWFFVWLADVMVSLRPPLLTEAFLFEFGPNWKTNYDNIYKACVMRRSQRKKNKKRNRDITK